MKYSLLALLFAVLIFSSCKTGKIVQVDKPAPVTTTITEHRDLDTLVVSAPKPDKLKKVEAYHLPIYHPSYERKNDLLHTKLELSFDWEKQYVFGKATLTFKPLFYPSKKLVLDAVGFDIHQISLSGQSSNLKYDYDGQKISIDLPKQYNRNESYKIFIDYTAKPAEGEIGGSKAITSEQGLFFINHDGSNPNKPMQIWSQGETENNSRWFPTIDKPNERCTNEIYLTVDQKYKTLSNGIKISSTNNTNGTRTDYWKMDQPHAPYLVMIAIGDFAVVEDKWNGIAVDYYVEPEFKAYARDIFSNTPEMLDFFSNKLGVKYPWPKYSQIVVRDYVSGAMENTTAVIFGEFVQKTKRELIDNNNEKVIAHELFHHWFGDLVTCESWANLTLNEGFANYSEYLWLEHKYGKDAADFHRYNELQGYLNSAQQGIHPLIYFGYKDKENMFDGHSYNKGGLILHMLRNYLGDEAFFASLQLYLNRNKYTSVEAHDLRLAFEDTTGKDLNWFFNQWFFSAGHPSLKIDHRFNEQTSSVEVTVEQIQNTDQMPAIFKLPLAIDIYFDKNNSIRKEVLMTKRKQNFSFKVPQKPKLVNVDPNNVLLMEKEEKKSQEEYIFQFYNAPNVLDQLEAISALAETRNGKTKKVFEAALKNDFWVIRGQGVDLAEPNANNINTIIALAKNDPRSDVRAMALKKIGTFGDKKNISVVKNAIQTEQAYPVISSALEALQILDFNEAKSFTKVLEKEDHSSIINAIGKLYAQSGDLKTLPYFESKFEKIDGY
ncbi:MAG TPA: alanyl aminopeptidase, partial [Saprospiraceae bacterium]|nr:alanyl aminopeptidase [Saprospiraceae bacterium]